MTNKAYSMVAIIERPDPETMALIDQHHTIEMLDGGRALPALKLGEDWRLVADAERRQLIVYGPPEVRR